MARLALLVLIGLLLPLSPSWADEDVEAQIQAALAAPGQAGIDALEKLLRKTTDKPAAQTVREALAVALADRGDPFASLQHWERLIDEDATRARRIRYAEALVAVARENLASGTARASSVVTYLIDARRTLEGLAPEGDDAGRLLRVHAEAWFFEGKLDEALAVLESASIDTLPGADARAVHDLLAQIQYRRREYGAAATAFESAGNDLGAAAAWAAAKNTDRTVAAYAKLLAAAPADLRLLGDAVSAARFVNGAAAMAETLAALELGAVADTVKAAHRIARFDLLEAAGTSDGNEPLLEEAAALDPADVEAMVRLGRLALGRGDRDTATTVFLDAFGRQPDDPRVANALWHLAGLDYQELWKSAASGPELGRSLRVQETLVAAAPDDATAWANLGNTRRVGGLTEQSIAAYERARAENPYDPAILSDLGLALSAAGRFEDALAAYVASIELDDSHLAGRQNAGRALWRTGRDDAAEAQLAAALRKARNAERAPMTYRFLLDRVWRTRQDGGLR